MEEEEEEKTAKEENSQARGQRRSKAASRMDVCLQNLIQDAIRIKAKVTKTAVVRCSGCGGGGSSWCMTVLIQCATVVMFTTNDTSTAASRRKADVLGRRHLVGFSLGVFGHSMRCKRPYYVEGMVVELPLLCGNY